MAVASATIDGSEAEPVDGASAQTLSRLLRRPSTAVAIVFLALLVVAAVLAPVLAPHDPLAQNILERFSGPSRSHWLGTDHLGRDLFTRLLYGARISLEASFGAVISSAVLAIPIGMLIGYRGGRLDTVAMRVVDGLLAIPALVLALAISGIRGASLSTIVLALGIVFFPGLVRFVRGQTLAIREETFVEASTTIGTPTTLILLRRVLPNLLSPLLVQLALLLGTALLSEAALSYIGLGVPPPAASWGNMLRDAYDNALFTVPWQLLVPGLAMMVVVLAFNLASDGLRDIIGGETPQRRRAHRRGYTEVADTAVPDRVAGDDRILLSIEDLSVEFDHRRTTRRVVDAVNLDIRRGEVLGLVGESGSGKTVTASSILRLIASPPGRIVSGSVWLEGRDLLRLSHRDLRAVRGGEIAMVFQDPMSSLNPSRTIGSHLVEAQRLHSEISASAAKVAAGDLLAIVEIPNPGDRLRQFPHELSGGMRQRVMLAMALAAGPKLLIADEPTTALDVTIQKQILVLLRRIQRETDMSVLFVTHDLGVVAELCDRVAVMYAGQIVEQGDLAQVFARPLHPYTEGLLASVPEITADRQRLPTIPGSIPEPGSTSGCRFAERCGYVEDQCLTSTIGLEAVGSHAARCRRAGELELRGVR